MQHSNNCLYIVRQGACDCGFIEAEKLNSILLRKVGQSWNGTYISFGNELPSRSGITKTWDVRSDGNVFLGIVKWWGAWRRYCYCPTGSTVHEQVCLREIAKFIEDRTREHREL